jgi:hypothetical protein
MCIIIPSNEHLHHSFTSSFHHHHYSISSKSERARRRVSVDLVRIFTSKEKKQAHAFRRWSQMSQSAALIATRREAQEALNHAVDTLKLQLESQKKDLNNEIQHLKRDKDDADKAHALAMKVVPLIPSPWMLLFFSFCNCFEFFFLKNGIFVLWICLCKTMTTTTQHWP